MRANTLRTVLLVEAIEESDPSGDILPLADRADATRAVLRRARPPPASGEPSPDWTRRALRLLAERAERLLTLLATRYPAVRGAGSLLGSLASQAGPLLLLAILLGLTLSTLDATRRIDILAFPLAGLIGWNLLVYLLLVASALHGLGTTSRRTPHPLAALLGRLSRWRAGRWLAQSAVFNAPLAEALRRFESEWGRISRPMLLARARRLLHVAAAVVAAGLVAGLYLRGIVLQYDAGWESTFLGPRSVYRLIRLVYGPAAVLTGIALPASSEEVATLRWDAPSGGADAAPWIHLIAATVALYVVLPRLLLAFLETLRVWRLGWRPPLPASLEAYARRILGPETNALANGLAVVVPLVHEPSAAGRSGLEGLLRAEIGERLRLEWLAPVRYGEEESLGSRLASLLAASAVDRLVLVVNLAATPEAENHGLALAAARDALATNAARTRLLVVVDESAYAARLEGDPALAARLDERRALWARFAAGYGLRSCAIDLARLPERPAADHPAIQAVRSALREARA